MLQERKERRWVRREILAMVGSMDPALLVALIDGHMSWKAEIQHGEVWDALTRIRRPSEVKFPGIYMNCICDGMGLSPTAEQWQVINNLMLTYVNEGPSNDQLAAQVDQLIYPDRKWPERLAHQELRRYTEGISSDYRKISQLRRNMVNYFVDQMALRIQQETTVRSFNSPLTSPVIKIGYSIDPGRRLEEHRRHRGSNYLMNLVETMFKHQYPGMFRLQ